MPREKEAMEMTERIKRRMQRLFTRKRPMRSSAILTLCFLLDGSSSDVGLQYRSEAGQQLRRKRFRGDGSRHERLVRALLSLKP